MLEDICKTGMKSWISLRKSGRDLFLSTRFSYFLNSWLLGFISPFLVCNISLPAISLLDFDFQREDNCSL